MDQFLHHRHHRVAPGPSESLRETVQNTSNPQTSDRKVLDRNLLLLQKIRMQTVTKTRLQQDQDILASEEGEALR